VRPQIVRRRIIPVHDLEFRSSFTKVSFFSNYFKLVLVRGSKQKFKKGLWVQFLKMQKN